MKALFLIVITSMLTGCAIYGVDVDSMAAPDAANYKTYYLTPDPSDKKIIPGSLEYQGYASQVERALKTKGLARVPQLPEADFILLFGYGIGTPTTTHGVIGMPTYGQTGVSQANTTAYLSGNTYTATTNYTPSYGVTGYAPMSFSQTEYPFYISLMAFDKQGLYTPQAKQLWQTWVTTASRNSDMRKAFPYMLDAAMPYLIKDSGGRVTVTKAVGM